MSLLRLVCHADLCVIMKIVMKYKAVYQFRWVLVVFFLTLIWLCNLTLIKLPFISFSFQKGEMDTGLFAFLQVFLPRLNIEMNIYNIQAVAVWFCGITLGPILALITLCIYLAIGIFGVPVFAGGGGATYFEEPTFGYLLSLPLNAFLAGYLYKNGKLLLSAFVPILTTHLVGIIYLALFKQSWLNIAWHISFSMISYDLIFVFLLLPLVPFISFVLNEMVIQEVPTFSPFDEGTKHSIK